MAWILGTGYWVPFTGDWLLATGYWLLATGYWVGGTRYSSSLNEMAARNPAKVLSPTALAFPR